MAPQSDKGFAKEDFAKDSSKASCCSFLNQLEATVQQKGGRVFSSWYNSKGKVTKSYTFRQIWEEARFIANYLLTKKMLEKGDRVILCYSFGLQFFSAFLGCLASKGIRLPSLARFLRSEQMGERSLLCYSLLRID